MWQVVVITVEGSGGQPSSQVTRMYHKIRIRRLQRVHRRPTVDRGFTLAELMVTLLVSALLFGVGIPTFSTVVKDSRQASSTNELVATMNFARDLAITRNARVTVCPSAAGNTCEGVTWDQGWIVFEDPDEDQAVDADETVERASGGFEKLDVDTAAFGGFMIYRPNGRVMVNSVAENFGEFTFCDDRGALHARVLIIEVNGRPRISSHTAQGAVPTCP
jgi:type IV fimbrial biogenesis protein FimT